MIERLLKSLPKDRKYYAVFDCDETIIKGDVGYLGYTYILENNLFKVPFEKIAQDLKNDYGIDGVTKDNVIEKSNYYYSIKKIDITTKFWQNYTELEIQDLIREAIEKTNLVKIKEDIRNLFNLLKEYDVQIYICSASPKPLVDVIADIYGIERKNVLAINFEVQNGRYTGKEIGIATRSEGKVTAIKSLGYDYPPIIIGGDSDGDYEMLKSFKILHGMIMNPKENSKVKRLVDNVVYFEYI